MPKKIRSQKIIAELRRKLAKEQQGEAVKPVKKNLLISPKIEMETKEKPSSFVISDLRKSLFLTTLAISLEIVLYYMLEKGGIEILSSFF